MASTGTSPALPATLPFTPGQGSQPIAWILYTTDDASDPSPEWQDASQLHRGFSTDRGRDSEQGTIDAGTASIILDDRGRDFDRVANPLIDTGNRWWIREQFSGETHHVFYGYAEEFNQDWPGQVDDVVKVSCADEFKPLARDNLPTTAPPRAGYNEVVQSDNPAGFWPLDDPPETRVQEPDAPPATPTPTPVTPPPPTLLPPPEGGGDWGFGPWM